jgi:hypothetical protein
MGAPNEIKHHARFYFPGSFFAEDEAREIPERTVAAALAIAPERAFAFEFYDTAVVDFEFDADLYRVIPRALNESGRHYIGGTVYTSEELLQLAAAEGEPGRYDVLIANVSQYDGRAIRCRTGNWQPYEGEPVEDVPASHPPQSSGTAALAPVGTAGTE